MIGNAILHCRVEKRTLQDRVPLLSKNTECVGQRDIPATHHSESSRLSALKDGHPLLVDCLSTFFVSLPVDFVISGKETSLERPCPIYYPPSVPHSRPFGGKWIVHFSMRAPNSPQLVPSREASSQSEKDAPRAPPPNLTIVFCVLPSNSTEKRPKMGRPSLPTCLKIISSRPAR